jgi:hypothetical protein
MQALWKLLRVPMLVLLALFEPFFRILCVSLSLLGLLTVIVFRLSGTAPHFPTWGVLGFSFTYAMLLPLYYLLIRMLGR